MTIEQLKELERLADGATKGPWHILIDGHDSAVISSSLDLCVADVLLNPKDATYISAADPTTVKTLIRALRSMASKCSELYMEKVADENFWPHKGDIAKKANELLQQALQEAEK
jgi:hypothetical protein